MVEYCIIYDDFMMAIGIVGISKVDYLFYRNVIVDKEPKNCPIFESNRLEFRMHEQFQ